MVRQLKNAWMVVKLCFLFNQSADLGLDRSMQQHGNPWSQMASTRSVVQNLHVVDDIGADLVFSAEFVSVIHLPIDHLYK